MSVFVVEQHSFGDVHVYRSLSMLFGMIFVPTFGLGARGK